MGFCQKENFPRQLPIIRIIARKKGWKERLLTNNSLKTEGILILSNWFGLGNLLAEFWMGPDYCWEKAFGVYFLEEVGNIWIARF